VADYQSDMKATDVARKQGINEWTVRHRLRRSGVPLRPISMSDDEIALTSTLRARASPTNASPSALASQKELFGTCSGGPKA
jgi:hypothetical protein